MNLAQWLRESGNVNAMSTSMRLVGTNLSCGTWLFDRAVPSHWQQLPWREVVNQTSGNDLTSTMHCFKKSQTDIADKDYNDYKDDKDDKDDAEDEDDKDDE